LGTPAYDNTYQVAGKNIYYSNKKNSVQTSIRLHAREIMQNDYSRIVKYTGTS